MRGFTLQPAAYVDNIYPDPVKGIVEGERLPYPFHVDEAGNVDRQDFWRGEPLAIIGFQADPDVQQVDLHWRDFLKAPQAAVGMLVVGVDGKGGMATYNVKSPLRSVVEYELPDRSEVES